MCWHLSSSRLARQKSHNVSRFVVTAAARRYVVPRRIPICPTEVANRVAFLRHEWADPRIGSRLRVRAKSVIRRHLNLFNHDSLIVDGRCAEARSYGNGGVSEVKQKVRFRYRLLVDCSHTKSASSLWIATLPCFVRPFAVSWFREPLHQATEIKIVNQAAVLAIRTKACAAIHFVVQSMSVAAELCL